ncbi:MAG: hypothetical protein H7267_01925 [Sandarakinorhabdus sp.]|nr:hypothetical protein [Sandarakinorhabdus sp.]
MKYLWVLLVLSACSAEAPKPVAAKVKAEDANPYPVYGVAVAKDGLLLTDPKTKQAKPASFGLRQSLLLAIVARTFGAGAEGHDEACGKDFARWSNGLTLWFDAGGFVGWDLQDGAAAVGTAPGLARAATMRGGARCRQKSPS